MNCLLAVDKRKPKIIKYSNDLTFFIFMFDKLTIDMGVCRGIQKSKIENKFHSGVNLSKNCVRVIFLHQQQAVEC